LPVEKYTMVTVALAQRQPVAVSDRGIRVLGSRIALLWVLMATIPLMALEVTVCRDASIPNSVFAVGEIRTAVSAVGGTVTEVPLSAFNATGVTGVRVILARKGDTITGWDPLPTPSVPQAYGVRVKKTAALQDILVMGFDAAGTLYGGLDVAEAISMATLGTLTASDHAPHIAQRGIKLNIPLDLRNPSYSDASDSAQALLPKVWDLNFWMEYLDEMARQRLNTLSLWNCHPFPSMVTVKDFPLIALSDVWRTKVPFTSTGGTGTGFYEPAKNGLAPDVDVIKKITPAQKTAFWNQVIDLAEARGISVYIFTWNILTDGTEGNGYGIVDDSASSATKQASGPTKTYFRASVRALLTAMPKLAGFGITGGEQMSGSSQDKVQWLADTYGAGINDVRVGYTVTAPDGSKTVVPPSTRPLRLIIRSHQVNVTDLDAIFGPVYYKNYTVDTSYKYSIAHTFSTTKPGFYTGTMEDLSDGKRAWLTVRFDDQYNARWGDPDFVRSWVNNIPTKNGNGKDQLNGYYMGPDGFIWGLRSNTKDSTLNQADIKRWWYTQSLFSRLSYDPTITNAFFDQLVATRLRLSLSKAASLNQGLALASQITPWLTKYYWGGGNDFENFVEGCTTNNGFLTVTQYMNNDPIGNNDGTGQSPLTLTDFCTQERQGNNPINIADKIDALATAALNAIASVSEDPVDSELNQTLDDIRMLVAMGKYYAEKFRGARDLKYADIDKADATKSAAARASAVTHLTNALALWTTYAELSAQRYYPTRHNRIGNFDVFATIPYVAGDIAIAKQLTTGGPSVATQPTLVSQSGASATLTVRGASTSDNETQLKYFWLLDGTHPAGVNYTANGNNAARDITVTFTSSGRYRFKVVILDTNNRYKATNTIEVRYVASTTNQPPTANAGPNKSVTLPASVSLAGSATDDGLPSGSTLTTTWSKVSGPGTVTFANASATSTNATFSLAGTYLLRLTASDGTLSANNDMSVVVTAASGGGTTAPPKPAAPNKTGDGTATPTVSGTTTPGATVHIVVDGTEVGTVTAGADGTWSYTISGIPAGSHVITVTAGNAGGTSSPSEPTNVTIAATGGTTPPASSGGASGGGGSCGSGSVVAGLLIALFALGAFCSKHA
jgi:Bacterial Ig-like domain